MSGRSTRRSEARHTPAERFIDVDGLAYRALSTPALAPSGAAPFVLVHGIGVSHRYLSRLHDELSRTADVHSIDLPGFGGLPKPDASPDAAAMASGLGIVLDELGLAAVVAVGHSMGTQWVTELAVQRPAAVGRVVLMGPVADERHRTPLRQAVALARDTLGEPIDVNAVVLTDYVRCGPAWYLAQLPHMLSYPLEDRVAELTQPVLVLRGGSDPIAGREWCRRLVAAAPSATLVEIPGHHHVAQHSAPRAVASAIEHFTKATETRASAPRSCSAPVAVIASGGGRYGDPYHPFTATSAALADVLRADGWEVTVFAEPEAALAALASADLLVVNAGPGDGHGRAGDAAARGLYTALDRGIGVLSVHSSLHTLGDLPRWRRTIGGAWVDGVSWHPEISDAAVHVVDGEHPVTGGLDDVELFDERYTDLVIDDPDARVLAVHELEGVRHPLIWVREAGASRVVVSALGHDERSYESEPHRALIVRAARWAARR